MVKSRMSFTVSSMMIAKKNSMKMSLGKLVSFLFLFSLLSVGATALFIEIGCFIKQFENFLSITIFIGPTRISVKAGQCFYDKKSFSLELSGQLTVSVSLRK